MNRQSKQKENARPGRDKKSKSTKNTLEARKQEAIKTEYFQVHDPNVARNKKVVKRKMANNSGVKKSVSKSKK